MSRADPAASVGPVARLAEIAIREFRRGDMSAIVALADELRRYEASLYTRMQPEGRLGSWYVADLLADCDEARGRIFVAELKAEIVGYVCVRAHVVDEARDRTQLSYAMIDDLVVTRALRGRGIGRRLMDAAQDYSRRSGANWIRIGVLARNASAHELYRRAGFDDHLVVLEKRLNGRANDSES